MDVETAQIVVTCIAGVDLIVWLMASHFVRKAAKSGCAEYAAAEFDFPGQRLSEVVTGSIEVDNDPATLSRKAASLVVADGQNTFGPVKIVERSDSLLALERLGPSNYSQFQLQPGRSFGRAQLHFSPLTSHRTRIDYAIELSSLRWLLRGAWILLTVGLIVLGVGAWALLTYVATSPIEGIRWQSVQMVQVIHFLWPPFLLAALYSRARREVTARFEAFVHNLPHFTD